MIRVDRRAAAQEHERWLKRQAIHIVAQLPESEQDALAVLAYAKQLVAGYLSDEPVDREARMLRLVSEAGED